MMTTVPLGDIPIPMRLTAAFRRAVSGLEGGGAIVRKLVLKVIPNGYEAAQNE
jgi:hypothetical protein